MKYFALHEIELSELSGDKSMLLVEKRTSNKPAICNHSISINLAINSYVYV